LTNRKLPKAAAVTDDIDMSSKENSQQYLPYLRAIKPIGRFSVSIKAKNCMDGIVARAKAIT
jgi:hypothetical protein